MGPGGGSHSYLTFLAPPYILDTLLHYFPLLLFLAYFYMLCNSFHISLHLAPFQISEPLLTFLAPSLNTSPFLQPN